ncbi:MAG: methyl-accepting chemotaxis protein [Candidatus Omnitrophica bacterium]|nr:methyl-accepting chemotaxis protein [Candidatus Omnitrophota bacterium]
MEKKGEYNLSYKKRRQYLVATDFQLRFVGLILLFMFAMTFFSAITIYYNIWMLLGEKLANVYPQARLAGILKSANLKLLLNILVLTPFVIIAGIVLSHRIAGPIYRLKQDLEAVKQGKYSLRIQLRKKDEFQDLAKAINTVIEELDSKDKELKAKINT